MPAYPHKSHSLPILFKLADSTVTATAAVGESILSAAHRHKVPLEGACEGNLACSTCHVILEPAIYNADEISDKENDLIDLAYGVKPTSRLACQVFARKDMFGRVFEIPRCSRNLSVDGYQPPLH